MDILLNLLPFVNRSEQGEQGEPDDFGPKECRICLSGEQQSTMIRPCQCRGTIKYVHSECLDMWRASSQNENSFFSCDQCQSNYVIVESLDMEEIQKAKRAFKIYLARDLIVVCASIIGLYLLSFLTMAVYNNHSTKLLQYNHYDNIWAFNALTGFFLFIMIGGSIGILYGLYACIANCCKSSTCQNGLCQDEPYRNRPYHNGPNIICLPNPYFYGCRRRDRCGTCDCSSNDNGGSDNDCNEVITLTILILIIVLFAFFFVAFIFYVVYWITIRRLEYLHKYTQTPILRVLDLDVIEA